jgi:hypothetical protein
MSISDQARHQIDPEIANASMARMLDLVDIFELVYHGLNNRTFADQYPVDPFHRQAVLGVGYQFGDELHA